MVCAKANTFNNLRSLPFAEMIAAVNSITNSHASYGVEEIGAVVDGMVIFQLVSILIPTTRTVLGNQIGFET